MGLPPDWMSRVCSLDGQRARGDLLREWLTSFARTSLTEMNMNADRAVEYLKFMMGQGVNDLISELAFRALHEAAEYAQEAVQGELKNYDFLQEHCSDLSGLAHEKQTAASLEVYWECLIDRLYRGVGFRWRVSNWFVR